MLEILQNNWLLFLVGQYPHGPIGGLTMTLFMAATALTFCFPFAIALALARLSSSRWLRGAATAIVHTVRGLPLIMFIFWTYFFSPLVIGRAVGGVETLITRPATTSHSGMSPADRARAGISDGLVRLSVGLESSDDLIEDFETALAGD